MVIFSNNFAGLTTVIFSFRRGLHDCILDLYISLRNHYCLRCYWAFGPCLDHVRVERPKVLLYTKFCPPGPLESEPNSRKITRLCGIEGIICEGFVHSFFTLALAMRSSVSHVPMSSTACSQRRLRRPCGLQI